MACLCGPGTEDMADKEFEIKQTGVWGIENLNFPCCGIIKGILDYFTRGTRGTNSTSLLPTL